MSANYRPSVGGIERFTEVLAEGLAERGHEPTVLACRASGAPKEERRNGVNVVRLPASDVLHRRLGVPYPIPAPHTTIRTTRHLLARTDVVHVQDALYATSVSVLVIARKLGVPRVLTQHVAFVPQANRALDVAEKAAIATVGRCARLADEVVALTPSVGDWAQRTWRLHNVQVLPIGTSRPAEPVSRTALRDSFGLPRDRFVALFVGRDVPKKRLDLFLESGDDAYDLVAVTNRDASTARSARIMPFMSIDRLHALLGCVDAFVLPSEGEGLPVALQEALLAGVPAVLVHDPGYDHFLSADEVFYVDSEPTEIRNAIRRLADDTELREALARRGRHAAEREFGVERFVAAYEALYERVTEAGR